MLHHYVRLIVVAIAAVSFSTPITAQQEPTSPPTLETLVETLGGGVRQNEQGAGMVGEHSVPVWSFGGTLDVPQGEPAPVNSPDRGPTEYEAIAVTAFTNISGVSQDAWVDAGIVETVTADLEQLAETSVVGRKMVADLLERAGLAPDTNTEAERQGNVPKMPSAH